MASRNAKDMMKKKQSNKWKQYIGAPKRFLTKARDFYVDSMVSMDGKLASYNNMVIMPCPAPQISQIPIMPQNSGSNNSATTTTNTLNIRDESYLLTLGRSSTTIKRNNKHHGGYYSNNNGKRVRFEGVNRSYSVGLGRIDPIDEDNAYDDFHEDEDHSIMFARSRSHAVPTTSRNNPYYFK